jgi:adenosylcobinamide-phosphate synthase
MTAVCLALALVLDWWWGEPRRWHPLVGFGRAANFIESKLNHGDRRIVRGLLAWCLLLLPLLTVAVLLQRWCASLPSPLALVAQALIIYVAVALRGLNDHAHAVTIALHAEDLTRARYSLSMIVSRDTTALNSTEISSATIESVLENGSDAVIATLFWFAVAGIPGVVVHRAANTLDAMWGYRNLRYNEFGRIAARVDDVLNFIPARLTALGYALCGNTATAVHSWSARARAWGSPNAGPVMAAGAGALQVQLGGAAYYEGKQEQRPPLGCGHAPNVDDIARAQQLVLRTAVLFVATVFVSGWLM